MPVMICIFPIFFMYASKLGVHNPDLLAFQFVGDPSVCLWAGNSHWYGESVAYQHNVERQHRSDRWKHW